ncbi:MAG: M56 family metallopeptidase [Vicinamibacterales bacterium]
MILLLDAAVRSSLMLAAGLGLHAALSRRSAAQRHWVLAMSIVAAAAVVPLSVWLPRWEVAVPAARQPVEPGSARVEPFDGTGVTGEADGGSRAPDARWPLWIWAGGVVVSGGRLLTGVVRLARIARRAPRVDGGPWHAATAAVAEAYGIRRRVIVLQTDLPHLLATWGALRPRVLLPSHAGGWPADRIHAVACHELAHVKRQDWLVQISAQALLALLWFNPLMWLACRRLRRDSEQACDDAVLERGVPARDYAAHLLELARQYRRPTSVSLPATPMAHPSTLERRIAAMLNPRLDRSALSRGAAALSAVLLLAVAVPTAAFRAVQSGPAPLSGSVYDTTGGVLPGVQLTLEDSQQTKWQATSDRVGRFEFPAVAPGPYVLGAALRGFRALRHEVALRDSRDWSRAVTLQVGDLQESITVRESRLTAAPALQPRGPEPVRVGGNIRVPRKTFDVRPVYPVSMREAGLDGVVPIDAVIGRDGTVASVRVLTAQVHPDLAMAAVDAVRQWRFTPTLLNGTPVDVVMTVTVRFNLGD